MEPALLDTDILSEVLKARDPHVLANAGQYLREHPRLGFSAMTFYEVLRGLLSKNAVQKINALWKIAKGSEVFAINSPTLLRAAELWSDARAKGKPAGDADLIIAATAIERKRVLVTGNTDDFSWIAGLRIENWRSASQQS